MDRSGGRAFDALRDHSRHDPESLDRFAPHPAYSEYLKIHKILVGKATARKLERIHDDLHIEVLPRYLSVAGWAAAEAALALTDRTALYRNDLLEKAKSCWTQALENQLHLNNDGNEAITEASAPYRYALDLAHLPLLQAMISGDVTDTVRQEVALDVLNIAEANAVQMNLATRVNDSEGIGDHIGVGYECNGLLAFHSLNSPSLFAIPSSARADSGHHHPNQTHDLVAIQQKWGTIVDMTPIEIKSRISQRDKARYKALLVRGKMHLSIEGKHSPEHTLRAFSALYAGKQTKEEKRITDHARHTIINLYWLYKKGDELKDFAAKDSAYRYRDASSVHRAHPEVAPYISL